MVAASAPLAASPAVAASAPLAASLPKPAAAVYGFPIIQTKFSQTQEDADEDDEDEEDANGAEKPKAQVDAPAPDSPAVESSPKKKKSTKKKKKDPNCPKGVKGAFFIYLDEHLPATRAANPTLARKECMNKVSDSWKALPDEVKVRRAKRREHGGCRLLK